MVFFKINKNNTKIDNGHKFSHVKNQFLSVAVVNLATLTYGSIVGWLSPALIHLLSEDTPLNGGPLTTDEVSWIGAIVNVGSLCGNFGYTTITNYYGRKLALCLLAIPGILFWLAIAFARDLGFLYAARIIAGLVGGGSFICVPLFIAEIASDHVRGRLGSFLMVSLNLGILISYLVGAYVPYEIVPFILLVFPILYFCGVIFLPDTPQYLMKIGKYEQAEKSLRFYKGCPKGDQESEERFEIEFENLKRFTKSNENKETNKVTFKDFCTPEARRGLLLGVTMMSLNVFSGGLLFLNYASSIFTDSGSDMDPNISAIIMISLQLIGTYFSTFIVDRFGRRVLMIASTSVTSTGLLLMGTFTFLNYKQVDLQQFNWVPVASLSIAVFGASIGLIPLVFVILAEVLPKKIREFGSTCCIALISVFLLVVVKLFPILAEIVGLYSCFWFFSAVCIFGLFFSIFILPETNGKNINNVLT